MSYAPLDVKNKIVVVTGGTSGLGRAVALGFAQAGACIAAASSNPDKVAAMDNELSALGARHHTGPLDVTDPQAVENFLQQVAAKFGRIDALVHAAGIMKRCPAADLSIADFERVLKVNLTGNFIVAQAVGRIMLAQTPDKLGIRGSITNIASLSSFVSFSEVIAYSVSKAGVNGITRGLANEWTPHGVRVNAIAPGVFPTELNRPLIDGTPRGQWIKAHTPAGRFGNADEIVGLAIYLASDAASFTSGQTIAVDGGFLAKGV